ncbi:hypothetical protein F8M41_024122 [Gigaspora margarita]|uniref:Uncharacterized protein n=1 Tax=Gigaspora margarita TaxID=4874 RepID=A0A8H4B0P0_GIGMA|nr:hypothetical protein F8M41_024122 [Gigaspora margarita]
MDKKILLKCFLTYLKSCEKKLPRLYDFLICVQKNLNNKVASCHKILIHKDQQPNEIKILYEDITKNHDKGELKLLAKEKLIHLVPTFMNFASGRLHLELAKCDDFGQLEDFDKYVNDIIKKQQEIIIQRTQENQKQQIFEKWIEITKFCPQFTLTSLNCFKKDFIQQDILDPFYCLTIDLFRDFNLWKCVFGTNFSWIKFADHSISISLNDIHKINHAIQQSFEDFNTQNPFIHDPNISIDCSPCLNLTLEDDFSKKTKLSINEILQSWPEHPTYCSYERKSYFFESSINDDREISDNQVFDQFSLENRQSSDLKKSEGVITSKKKYYKKVDVTISYRIDKGINEKREKNYRYIYPIL